MPSVAIAGYTNAGKSSLLNRLTGAGVLVENQLFATLDPTVRRAETEDGRLYTLADTVGFVRQLPTQLVEAFRSTLEEVADADLLLHVVDGSHPDPEGQISAVRAVLADVEAANVREVIVINKADAADPEVLDRIQRHEKHSIVVSARTGAGLDELRALIAEELPRPDHRRRGAGALRPRRPGQPAAPGGRGAVERAHRERHPAQGAGPPRPGRRARRVRGLSALSGQDRTTCPAWRSGSAVSIRPEVAALLAEHVEDMRRYSPPESVHTLDLDRLRTPDLTFWSLWDGEEVLGCAALRELDPTHGELKSMRTASAHRRRGVAAALLDHVVAEARRRGYARLSLETGSPAEFAPARTHVCRVRLHRRATPSARMWPTTSACS